MIFYYLMMSTKSKKKNSCTEDFCDAVERSGAIAAVSRRRRLGRSCIGLRGWKQIRNVTASLKANARSKEAR